MDSLVTVAALSGEGRDSAATRLQRGTCFEGQRTDFQKSALF
jgi:hypothetical protein